jgi:hypothetical protein
MFTARTQVFGVFKKKKSCHLITSTPSTKQEKEPKIKTVQLTYVHHRHSLGPSDAIERGKRTFFCLHV